MTTQETIQEIKNCLNEYFGFNIPMSVSETNFGTSCYIQNEYGKIRISDHSVTNFNRIWNETHFFFDSVMDSTYFLKAVEMIIFPENFTKITCKKSEWFFTSTVVDSEGMKNFDVNYPNNIITEVREFVNKKGITKFEVFSKYTRIVEFTKIVRK